MVKSDKRVPLFFVFNNNVYLFRVKTIKENICLEHLLVVII